MKSFITFLAGISLCVHTMAQVPQGISYQAIAFQPNGLPVANGNVGVKISVLDNSASGPVVYAETHTKTTNAQGLFNLSIGQGTPTSGTFSGVSWATNSKFLKVEIDPAGGTNYTIAGSSQLMSVPYALYAENTNPGNLPSNPAQTVGSKTGIVSAVYTSSNAYGFAASSGGSPQWNSTPLSGTPIGALATDSCLVVYTSSNVYGFARSSGGSPQWTNTPISGTPQGISASGNSIVVFTSSNAYGFARSSGGSPQWNSTPISGTPQGTALSGKDCVVIYTSSNAYGFMRSSGGSPQWNSTPISGTPLGGSASGSSIIIYTTSNAYGFARSSGGSPQWTSTPISGTPVESIP